MKNQNVFKDDFNAGLLRKAVEGVEDNNDINDAQWSDWDSVRDIMCLYCDCVFDEDVEAVIQDAIDTNGESLAEDLKAIQLAVQGQNFAGSWWNRV